MRSSSSSTSGKKEKEKDAKEKEGHSSHASDVDRGDVSDQSNKEGSRVENGGSSKNRMQEQDGRLTSSDMDKFCDAISTGFDKLSKNFGEKLEGIGDKFSTSLNEMYESIQEDLRPPEPNMPLLEEENLSDYSWPDDNGGRRDHGDDHSISDISESSSAKGTEKKSYFKKMNKPRKEQKIGDEVDPDLAEAVDRAFSKGLPSDEVRELREKYIRPKNVEFLRLPDVAENVYRRLPSDHKDKDKLLKYVQHDLYPVAIALTVAADKIGSGDIDGGMDVMSDTISLFGHVVKTSLTDKRRSMLKTKLPEDFRVLVSDDCPPTATSLLGNISENTKKVAETEKLATQMDRASKLKSDQTRRWKNRSKPYEKSGNNYNNNNNNNNNNQKGKNSFFAKKGYGWKNSDYNKNSSGESSGYNKSYGNGSNASGKAYFQKKGQRK